LDVLMPGLDGWAVLSQLKADPSLAPIPVIMLSIIEDKTQGYTLGAVDYLVKPVDRRQLMATLQKYRALSATPQVLVVEDEADTREMMQRMLETAGWRVATAENGQVALNYMTQHTPTLIVLDLMMPRMDGFDFIDNLRKPEQWRSIPVVVVTAKDLTTEDHQRLNHSVSKILQKGSFEREDLLAEVSYLVRETLRQNGGAVDGLGDELFG
jgi:CheY-like chemotaxis protein